VGIRLEREALRKGMRKMRQRHAKLMDLRPAMREVLVAAKNEIQRRVYADQLDTHGKRFTPLAERTVREKRQVGFNPMTILHETGAMLADRTFKMDVGKRRGTLTHLAPTGSHTKVAHRTRKGGTRMRAYDYGLAHQYSRKPRLPRRQWWLEPESVKGAAFFARAKAIFLKFIRGGQA